jgi:hypothetical protein
MVFIGDVYMTHTRPNMNIHYCPWWFLDSEQFMEVLANFNHYQSHNLSAFYTKGSIPHALERAIQAFSYGYNKGRQNRPKPAGD